MSKSSKAPPSQKANEIKDLLLDVIQQEDASMSETEIYRLSQPYKKGEPSPFKVPVPSEREADLELNFEDADAPSSAMLKEIEAGREDREDREDREVSMMKIDFNLNADDSDAPNLVPLSLAPMAKPVISPPPVVRQPEKVVAPVKVEQPIKPSSPIPFRPPLEAKVSEIKPPIPVSSSESTVRLTPKPKDRTPEAEVRVASGGSTTNSVSVFKQEARVGVYSPAEAVLKQSENLRIAQIRISSLEDELEKLREDNSQLSSAGDILRRRADELLSQTEILENKVQESAVIFDDEKKVLKAQLQSKDKELEVRRQKIDQIEHRLNSQFESIRRRERELEHRLEILKVENQDILNGKDKMILDLKRQVDLLNTEIGFSKERTQELYGQHRDKQETIRRVVKALRMALTILEGDEETKSPLKKVD